MGRRPAARTPAGLLRTQFSRQAVFLLVLISLLLTLTPSEAWAAPPSNDDFDNATNIASLPYTATLDTTDATAAADDPVCYGYTNTVWYKFTPSADRWVTVDTSGSDYLVTASVSTGTRGDLTHIACSYDQPAVSFDANVGTTYFLMFAGNGVGGNLTLSVEAATPPSNDDFDSAATISDLPFSDSVDVRGATRAADDPDCGGHSVWYAFTPDQGVRVAADTFGSSYDTTLCVYTGSRGNLTLITYNTDWGGSQSRVELDASGAETYFFMVGSPPGGGDLVFHVEELIPPPNDDFDNATVIPAVPFTGTTDTTGATTAADDPNCSGNVHTVWYSFTPDHDMFITAARFGSAYETTLSVYTGQRGSLSQLACIWGGLSELQFDASGGTTYYFMLVNHGIGEVSISVEAATPPPNDDFDDAVVIPGLPFTDGKDTRGATPALDDPSCLGNRHSVWYSFTPGEDMFLSANTFGSSYAAVVSAYTGTPGSLIQVACNEEGPVNVVQFYASGGTTYFFMLSSLPSEPGGDLAFSLERVKVPTTLGLSVSKRRVSYNQTVKVTAHLDQFETAPNATVEIYMTPHRGDRTLVDSGEVDAEGNFQVTVRMKKKTTFEAEWDGDANHLPGTSPAKVVEVRVITKTKLRGYYATSGAYKLYHSGDHPRWIGTVIPNHAGKPLAFIFEHYRGGWETVGIRNFRIRSTGSVTVILIVESFFNPPAGHRFRVRNRFDGDADHLRDYSPWVYFRMT